MQKIDQPTTKSPAASGTAETGGPKTTGADGSESDRTVSSRAERLLKEVDRLIDKNPETPPEQKAMARLDQAKVLALFQLAEAIRESNQR